MVSEVVPVRREDVGLVRAVEDVEHRGADTAVELEVVRLADAVHVGADGIDLGLVALEALLARAGAAVEAAGLAGVRDVVRVEALVAVGDAVVLALRRVVLDEQAGRAVAPVRRRVEREASDAARALRGGRARLAADHARAAQLRAVVVVLPVAHRITESARRERGGMLEDNAQERGL